MTLTATDTKQEAPSHGRRLAVLVRTEWRHPDPMLPPALLRRPAFTAVNATAGTMNMVGRTLAFVLPLYPQDIQGASPLVSGLALLPTLVLMGAGLGTVAPGVVAVVVGAVPPEHAGFASGLNNACRQAGVALGVAVSGVIGGSPAATASFVGGMHTVGVLGAVLYVSPAVVAAAFLRST